jgi:hypothetical protein
LNAASSTDSEGSLSWREEIDIVLQEWIAALGGNQGRQRWQRVGTAQPTGEPGVYVVDIRASDLTADQTDNLRRAGPDGAGVQAGFPVRKQRSTASLFACVWPSSPLLHILTCSGKGSSCGRSPYSPGVLIK